MITFKVKNLEQLCRVAIEVTVPPTSECPDEVTEDYKVLSTPFEVSPLHLFTEVNEAFVE